MGTAALDVARELIDAFNAGDRERFRAALDDNFVQREHATGTTSQGAEAAVESAFAWRAAFPDAEGSITRDLSEGDVATLQIMWTGTHDGDLHGPGGDVIPPSGKAVTIPACIVQESRDGKAIQSDHYFNLMTMLRQIGALG